MSVYCLLLVSLSCNISLLYKIMLFNRDYSLMSSLIYCFITPKHFSHNLAVHHVPFCRIFKRKNWNFMDQIPCCEANRCSDEYPALYETWCYHVLLSVLSQTHWVHTLVPHFVRIHFNIIILLMIKFSEWPDLFRFSYQIFVCILFSVMHATCPFHLIIFY
jgi:hypothetical protein